MFSKPLYRIAMAALLVLLPLAAASSAWAVPSSVGEIRIEGNQRVEEATVKSYLAISEDEVFDTDKIDESIKNLFATGLFSNVSIRTEGDTLIVNVKENPIINQVAFEGNKRLSKDQLLPEITLQSRSVYTRAKVQADVKRIQDLYRKNGRFAVIVEPKAIQLDQNRIDLVFEITEGEKTTVHKVVFVGNERFTDSELSKAINTKESRWYRFFSSSDTYDPDKLDYDKELLRKFYVSKGYADFRVQSTTAEITRGREAFIITFILEEGPKYKFGEVKIHSKLENVNEAKLKDSVATFPDETFNANEVDTTVNNLTETLNNLGYAFVEVNPVYKRDIEHRLVGITYDISEGPKVYVDRINVAGNVRTLDKVIRREFRLAEGDPYNASKLKRSQQRIENLGFFDNVQVDKKKGSADDKVDINVDVKEKSTGELNFGAGYSTTDGALASISVQENNLLGKGQNVKVALERSAKGMQTQLSFTEPYFMDKDLAAGFDVFKTTRDLSSESSYDSDTTGGVLRTTYSLTENLRHGIYYSLKQEEITDIQSDASTFIQRQAGANTTSLVGQSLSWDHRDNRFDPSEGFYAKITEELAGVGGDSKFLRHELNAVNYTPLFDDKLVFSLGGKGGYTFAWNGDDVRINERFFVGGSNFRGFRNAGIGPRDESTRDALGGNLYYVGTAELMFPLGLPEELGFKGAIFTDAGSLTKGDEEGEDILDNDSLRMSAGMGIAWNSPFGPIRVDYADPFMKESFDRTQEFRISFGTRF